MTDEPTSDIPAGTPQDDAVAHHDAAAHMDTHTVLSDDDHGHSEAALGPIDWSAWGYALVGALSGIAVLVMFFVATA